MHQYFAIRKRNVFMDVSKFWGKLIQGHITVNMQKKMEPQTMDSQILCPLAFVRKGEDKDSDVTGQMPRLIWVFAWRIGSFVVFV